MKVFLLFVFACGAVWASTASDLAWEAHESEKEGDVVRAYALYSQAAVLDPGNKKYIARSIALRSAALAIAKPMPPNLDLKKALPDAPIVDQRENARNYITDEDLADIKRLLPPPVLEPAERTGDFAIQGPAREAFERTLKSCGLDTVFDGDYAETARIDLKLTNVSCREAIRALELASGSFVFAVAPRLAMVAKDTAQKRQEQERTIAVSVPLPEPVSVQEAQELARAVQQMFEMIKFAVDGGRRIAVMRDRASKVLPARRLFEQLLHRRAEVLIDVEFIEVQRNKEWMYGLRLPGRSELLNFGRFTNVTNPVTAFARYLTFGGGRTLFGFGVTDLELFASMTSGSSETLLKSTLRGIDGMPIDFHVGDKFPVVTAQYSGGDGFSPGTPTGFGFAPQIQFEDLGLTLKVTPYIHGDSEVTLKIESEFKVLTGQTNNDIPVIANRKFQGEVRLRNTQLAMVAGLISQTDIKAFTGIVGLSQIPGLGHALRQNTITRNRGEFLLVFKPRIIAHGPLDVASKRLWVGTETRPPPAL